MQVVPLPISGAFLITPRVLDDDRGAFLEWYRHDALTEAVGRQLDLAQANCSVSRRGVVRGVHYADVPPGQAKYVTCVRGAVLDVVVDLRVGSPTFGRWESVLLDDESRRAVYLAEGLGHAFCALDDDATVSYLCSTTYNPAGRARDQPAGPRPRDRAGRARSTWCCRPRTRRRPRLAQARAAGALPTLERCRACDLLAAGRG